MTTRIIIFGLWFTMSVSCGAQTSYMEMVLKARNAAEARARLGISTSPGGSVTQTNILIGNVLNAGTAAYSNAATFYPASNPSGYTSFDGVFASLTSKPTTITGYGIMDFNSLGDARWQPLDTDLTAWAALATSAKQDASANLTAWSAIATATKEPAITAGTTAQYWRGDKTWQTLPAGGSGYRTKLQMTTNFVNAHAILNTLTNIPELSFSVTAGTTYKYEAIIYFTTAATTTGSRWCLTGPAMTGFMGVSEYTLTATTSTRNAMVQGVSLPAAANLTSAAGANSARLYGIFRPSANGTVSIAFASEVTLSAVTAQAGSTLEYW